MASAVQETARSGKKAAVGIISPPPTYNTSDFKSSVSWWLLGKLNVPKERFVSFPGCEHEADLGLVIAWVGWNHLQQSKRWSLTTKDSVRKAPPKRAWCWC